MDSVANVRERITGDPVAVAHKAAELLHKITEYINITAKLWRHHEKLNRIHEMRAEHKRTTKMSKDNKSRGHEQRQVIF